MSFWAAFRKLKRQGTRDRWRHGGSIRGPPAGQPAGPRNQLHRQSYRPQPSLRRDIPKGEDKTRPLGIAAVEDKIVQRAIVMMLERIYEVDFLDSSYGFRPGRSCHQALSSGSDHRRQKVNWISDADIRGFFDQSS